MLLRWYRGEGSRGSFSAWWASASREAERSKRPGPRLPAVQDRFVPRTQPQSVDAGRETSW